MKASSGSGECPSVNFVVRVGELFIPFNFRAYHTRPCRRGQFPPSGSAANIIFDESWEWAEIMGN
jgi:hypothetical protein